MPESFRRAELAAGALAGCEGAEELLAWAEQVARAAPAEAVYRQREGRKTLRVQLEGRTFFLKLHSGVGRREILKNLARGQRPVLDASSEFRALRSLAAAGIATPGVAAYACSDEAPATRRSMILTDDLTDTLSLEQLCVQWRSQPPPFALRLSVLHAVADIARRMHGAEWQHRDFYLCHLHVDPARLDRPRPAFYLIDLHRARRRAPLPQRWRVKDLAALYFSAMDCGLTERDLLRFLRQYSADGLRQALGRNRSMWRRVQKKANRLYVKTHGVEPPRSRRGERES
tara:strand:+ start:17399 stop:18259 length:861 start_codon:yes stop_codon:yes gene_type:complete